MMTAQEADAYRDTALEAVGTLSAWAQLFPTVSSEEVEKLMATITYALIELRSAVEASA